MRFAVRSSACGEDSEEMSAAGQMSTILGVTIDDVPSAVVQCWASQFGFPAVEYRRRCQIDWLLSSRIPHAKLNSINSQISNSWYSTFENASVLQSYFNQFHSEDTMEPSVLLCSHWVIPQTSVVHEPVYIYIFFYSIRICISMFIYEKNLAPYG